MRKKRARLFAGSLCGILAITTPIRSIATPTVSRVVDGISYADYASAGHEGYSVVKTDASALSRDTLVIPDTVDGKDVIHLDSNFLSGSGARRVEIGSKVIGMNADAFFEAKNLEEIVPHSVAFTVSADDPALYTYQYNFLLDYPSAASDGADYAVHDDTKVIYSMDNAFFGRLDLKNVDTLAKHALSGTTTSELVIADNARTTTGNGNVRLSLPGLHAGSFSTTSSSSGAYLQSDAETLYTSDGTLIKLASGVMNGVDWSGYQEIDTDAFDSMSQYWSLSSSIPRHLKKDKVFHFYNQNNGVFIVNDQIAFCYNSDKHIPDEVTDGADFSNIIDGANYDKVSAVMFVGVPYDGTGLFEETFGLSYEDAIQDAEMSRNGNAALNAVSSMIWELVDGKPSDIIDGIGATSYFTKENVQVYLEALRDAAAHSEDYTFSPVFEIKGGTLVFREQDDGMFLSDPFQVSAINGNGIRNDSYKIKMTLSGQGFGIYGSSGMDFMSGMEIRLTSQGKPEGRSLSFTYEKGNLKYYAPGGTGEQNLLVSGTKTENTAIQYVFEIKPAKEDFVISKRAVGSIEELAGASLKITAADGTVVDEWVSGDVPHTVSMLEDGVYILTETTAPDGYEVAENVTFAVTDGKVEGGLVVMYDAPEKKEDSSFHISKRDTATGDELPGASLKITDVNGRVVEEWVSTETPHEIKDLVDGIYTLTETAAPDGYEIADDITFIITNGKFEGNAVVMYDAPKEKKNTPSEPEKPNTPSEPEKLDKPEKPDGSFYVSKRDVANSNELAGAKLKITDANGNIVVEWTSADTPHKISGLADGIYTLTEVMAPQGYDIAESITFTIIDQTVANGTVVMYDKLLPRKTSGGGSHSSGGSNISHGPGVEPQFTEPALEPVIPSQEPIPIPTQTPSQLPKTDDQPSSVLVFWATALTLAELLADKKKCQMIKEKT